VLDLSVAENLWLGQLAKGPALGRIDRVGRRRFAERLIDEYGISCAGPDAPFSSLSGGNQQRVVLARELSAGPSVLIAAQPTHGLDVGAIEDMYRRLRGVAADGVGVLLISTELEEVMALASRIAVISRGRITGLMRTEEATSERLGLLVGGMAA
jgi:simple sugar transport system ATP-binding protein